MLDTQWIAAANGSNVGVFPAIVSTGHLRGLDDNEYEFTLWATPPASSRNFRLRTVQSPAGGPRTLIETALSIDTGETVVVGTSRVQGDKALIVLLTAVPK